MTRNEIAVFTPEASPRANTGTFDVSILLSIFHSMSFESSNGPCIENCVPSVNPNSAFPAKLTCNDIAPGSKLEDKSAGTDIVPCAQMPHDNNRRKIFSAANRMHILRGEFLNEVSFERK